MTNEDDKTYECQLQAVLETIEPVDRTFEPVVRARLDRLTKPLGSLGRLEDLAAQVGCVQLTDRPDVGRKAVLLMAADHGVVAEGVSPYPAEVTAQMVANFAAGGAAINSIARSVGAEVWIYDVGVASDLPDLDGVVNRKVAHGTANMAQGPAMTREQCARAVLVGIEAAREAAEQGIRLIGTGEMGIGNTTAAAAVTAAFTGADPEDVVGSGTGLGPEGVAHKAAVVRRALEVNATDTLDPLGKLAAVGGLELAALAGVVLGAAQESVCVVSDGFITGAATLAAVNMCPACAGVIFGSHRSVEPGHSVVLDALGIEPIVELDMRLGEGSGATLAMGIIDAAVATLSSMATFDEAGVDESADAEPPAEA